MTRRTSWNLRPRYTRGQPVRTHDGELAERIAEQEATGYRWASTGTYGPELQARATDLGVSGIVVERRGDKQVRDLVADQVLEVWS